MAASKTKPTGRKLMFRSVKDLEEKIEAYFRACDEQKRPYTISGLAVFLDCDIQTISNYEKNEPFFGTVKKAKERIHNYAEESLWLSRQTAGVIFNLKNNWGWKDKTETDVTSGGEKLQGVVMLPPREE